MIVPVVEETTENIPNSSGDVDGSHGSLASLRFWKICLLAAVLAMTLRVNYKEVTMFSVLAPLSSKNRTDIKKVQINNYVAGTGLMLSIHVTHHGGTFFCHEMGHVGPTPSFACMNGGGPRDNWPWSWGHDETDNMVKELRKYFHMISWEFGGWGNLSHTNWQHPNLLSVAIMRDPLERFLAGGKCDIQFQNLITSDLAGHPELNEVYWEYANAPCADNFALKVFTVSAGCCNGKNTNISYLEEAKQQIDKFTILIDQACETESIAFMADLLQLGNVTDHLVSLELLHHTHPSVRDRLQNDTLYEYLREKFKYDIELYEYAKSKSIVNCSTLSR